MCVCVCVRVRERKKEREREREKERERDPIWVSIKETKDKEGIYLLREQCSERSERFILHSDALGKCNNKAAAKYSSKAMGILWEENIKYDKMLLLITYTKCKETFFKFW